MFIRLMVGLLILKHLRDISDVSAVEQWSENIYYQYFLNDKQTHLEAHINLSENINMAQMMSIKENIEHLLQDKFNISHITLQMGYNCCHGKHELIVEKK